MALQGTLDTFALADVLRLLASTHKTGRLVIDGDRGTGSVWFLDGELIGGETPSTARSDGLPTVVFQMLRFGEGAFRFEADEVPDDLMAPQDVDDVIREAETMLAEWLEIEAVVPSMRSWLTLVPELDRDEDSPIKVLPAVWRLIVKIGAGSTVAMLGERTELEDLDLCRAVKGLVETGLVEVGDEVGDSLEAADRSYAFQELDLPEDLMAADPMEEVEQSYGAELDHVYGADFAALDDAVETPNDMFDEYEAEHYSMVGEMVGAVDEQAGADEEPDYYNHGDGTQTARRRLDMLAATFVGDDASALGNVDDQARIPLPEPLPEAVDAHAMAPIDATMVATDTFQHEPPAPEAPDAPEAEAPTAPAPVAQESYADIEPHPSTPEGWDPERGQWADTDDDDGPGASSWEAPAPEPEAARQISGLSPKAAEAIAAAASTLGAGVASDEPVLPGRSRLRRNVTSRR